MDWRRLFLCLALRVSSKDDDDFNVSLFLFKLYVEKNYDTNSATQLPTEQFGFSLNIQSPNKNNICLENLWIFHYILCSWVKRMFSFLYYCAEMFRSARLQKMECELKNTDRKGKFEKSLEYIDYMLRYMKLIHPIFPCCILYT